MNKMAADFAATRVDKAIARSFIPSAASTRDVDCTRLRFKLYVLLLVADAVVMACAFAGADLLRFGAMMGYGATTFTVLFPIYAAVGVNSGAWSMDVLTSPRASALAASRALCFAIGVATVLFFSLKVGEDFSRLVFGLGSAFALLFIAMARLMLGRRLGARYKWTFRKDVLLLDGMRADPAGRETVIDAPATGLRPDVNDPAMLDRLARALHHAERVTVACSPDRRQAWARALAGANLAVEVLVPELDLIGAIGLGRHGDVPALLVGCGPLRLRDRAIKRLFDLTVSASALVLLSPLLLMVAIAIRLDSPGPVLFRQPRIGRGNGLFLVLKFRSMRAETTDVMGDRSTSRTDSRITRVGRFLRNTSIDELPQLLNVLTGEMSIVGPRPHPLGCRAEDQLFWAIEDRYFDRHAIKPGITGLAQVRGFRGATWKRSDLTDRLKADLEYLRGWHLGRDIAIVARTVGVLVHPQAF